MNLVSSWHLASGLCVQVMKGAPHGGKRGCVKISGLFGPARVPGWFDSIWLWYRRRVELSLVNVMACNAQTRRLISIRAWLPLWLREWQRSRELQVCLSLTKPERGHKNNNNTRLLDYFIREFELLLPSYPPLSLSLFARRIIIMTPDHDNFLLDRRACV